MSKKTEKTKGREHKPAGRGPDEARPKSLLDGMAILRAGLAVAQVRAKEKAVSRLSEADRELLRKADPSFFPPPSKAAGRKRAKRKLQVTTKDRFSFSPGQALFDDHDLELPAGLPVEVLEALVHSFGRVVPHNRLHPQSREHEASDELRDAIRRIRMALKARAVPCRVISKHGEGYVCRSPTLPPIFHD